MCKHPAALAPSPLAAGASAAVWLGHAWQAAAWATAEPRGGQGASWPLLVGSKSCKKSELNQGNGPIWGAVQRRTRRTQATSSASSHTTAPYMYVRVM